MSGAHPCIGLLVVWYLLSGANDKHLRLGVVHYTKSIRIQARISCTQSLNLSHCSIHQSLNRLDKNKHL